MLRRSLLLACLLAFGAAVPARAQTASQLIVGYKAGTPASAVRAAAASYGASVRRMGLPNAYVLTATSGTLDTNLVIQDARVSWVEPARRTWGSAVTPFQDQWGLNNVGQFNGTKEADIDVVRAWSFGSYGAGVPVGIIDSGTNFVLPQLAGMSVFANPGEAGAKATNRIDDDGNGCVDDVRGCDFVDGDGDPTDANGHGTTTASVTLGPYGPSNVVGIAPQATLMTGRALDSEGYGTTATAASAIAYLGAIGARVVNISLVGPDSLAMRNAVAAYPNTLFIAAAGNDGADNDVSDSSYPCEDPAPNVICVGASTPLDSLSSFSNFGAASVDLVAPGQLIAGLRLNGTTGSYRGTSFAAPMVTGTAALLFAARPGATVAQVRAALLAGVERKPAFAGKVVTGGRLNAYNALAALLGVSPAPRPSTLKPTGPAGGSSGTTPTTPTAPPTPATTPWTTASGLPHTIDVNAKATLKKNKLKLTLKCKGQQSCEGSVAAITGKAKASNAVSYAIAANKSTSATLTVKLAKKAKTVAVAITEDGMTVRHTVKLKR
ncbi:S8 family serine peptidase [Solirubrobacter phytolaccae]|uniref:S8 family serine peptidase n=1 Tax=Solirubrobacter phytolaccae TaxID=1404360 RepID=A0A9X3S838_9ACTN|nr:S8 family serine peptidase [Solirubrobacter phytolaccae]MDA0181023.1 S8 family serine peptidase [Solirubrobacter phytolaccae]